MYNLETETSYLREPSTGVWDYSSGIAVFPVSAQFCSAPPPSTVSAASLSTTTTSTATTSTTTTSTETTTLLSTDEPKLECGCYAENEEIQITENKCILDMGTVPDVAGNWSFTFELKINYLPDGPTDPRWFFYIISGIG